MAGNALLDAAAILEVANLRPGMHVADFGAGRTGHLILPAARMLGEDGKVYAVDIHPEVLSSLYGYRSLHSLTNLFPLRGDIERFGGVEGIPSASLNRIFIINTLWSLQRLASVVAEARRLLAREGQIVVVDWEPNNRLVVAPIQVSRVAPQSIDRIFGEGGCRQCGEFQPSRHHWGRIYSH